MTAGDYRDATDTWMFAGLVLTVTFLVVAGVGIVGATSPVGAECTAGDGSGAVVGQTDSNLTYEYNHTPEVSIWHPDAETVHVENETDGWIRASSADTAEIRIEEHGVDRTCLGPVNAGDHDVHVAPEHQHNVTLSGTIDGLVLQEIDFDADDETELATNASSTFDLTIHDTGLEEGETVVLESVDDGGVDREADVDGSGTVTFEIPAGEHELAMHVDDGNGAAPPPPPPPPDDDEPASFEVTDRLVEPAEIDAGGTITASATVTNVGEETGTYTLELVVDGEVVASEDVTLAGGESETVSIEHGLDAPGEVEVSMAGESVETVSVQEADPPADDDDVDDDETDDDGMDDDDEVDDSEHSDDDSDDADDVDDDGIDDTADDTDDDDSEVDDGDDDDDDGLPWLWIALGTLAVGGIVVGGLLASGVLESGSAEDAHGAPATDIQGAPDAESGDTTAADSDGSEGSEEWDDEGRPDEDRDDESRSDEDS